MFDEKILNFIGKIFPITAAAMAFLSVILLFFNYIVENYTAGLYNFDSRFIELSPIYSIVLSISIFVIGVIVSAACTKLDIKKCIIGRVSNYSFFIILVAIANFVNKLVKLGLFFVIPFIFWKLQIISVIKAVAYFFILIFIYYIFKRDTETIKFETLTEKYICGLLIFAILVFCAGANNLYTSINSVSNETEFKVLNEKEVVVYTTKDHFIVKEYVLENEGTTIVIKKATSKRTENVNIYYEIKKFDEVIIK